MVRKLEVWFRGAKRSRRESRAVWSMFCIVGKFGGGFDKRWVDGCCLEGMVGGSVAPAFVKEVVGAEWSHR